jgi:acetolactate synthase-1/2/3 large subunit
MYGYEFIAQTFVNYGITHVFYVEAILRMARKEMEGYGIKGIMAHTENAAGYMADGYARATNKPGICMCQSVGAANLAGGIQDAWFANSPVVAITGKKPSSHQYKNSYQEGNHTQLFDSVTKFNADASDAEQIPFLLNQCFREATSGKPRPTHIDIIDHMGRIAEKTILNEPSIIMNPEHSKCPSYRFKCPDEIVEGAVVALEKACKPIIVAGRGAVVSGAGNEILKLAIKCDIPIATSPDGKCIIDENNDIWAGVVGQYGMDCGNKAVSNADLVLFIGTQTSDQTTYDWRVPSKDTQVIQIDIEPTELGKNYPNCIGLLGDAKIVVNQLMESVRPAKHLEWRQKVSEMVKDSLAFYDSVGMDSPLISPAKLCSELSSALPTDAVLVADTGFSAQWTSSLVRMRPGQKYLRAAGSLGWSIPASIGVKCGVGEKPVFVFCGDGAAYYHISELETAARYNIPIILIVNNNGILGQCSGDIDNVYNQEKEKSHQHYTFSEISFSRIASELGCLSFRSNSLEEFRELIPEAVNTNRPTVIEVSTDPKIVVPGSWFTEDSDIKELLND